jgi:hypothetical protein
MPEERLTRDLEITYFKVRSDALFTLISAGFPKARNKSTVQASGLLSRFELLTFDGAGYA